jgi:hypothetical protein
MPFGLTLMLRNERTPGRASFNGMSWISFGVGSANSVA